MMFCKNCGAPLGEGDTLCPNCGAEYRDGGAAPDAWEERAEAVPVAHYEVSVPCPELPTHTDFSCMLAYIPGLFWVPLVSDRRDDTHREAANQGLILTVLWVLSGAIAGAVLGVLWSSGYDFGQIGDLFTGVTAQNWPGRLPQILGWLSLTALVMYVPINSICGFFHGIASGSPYRVTLFGRLRLIGPFKNG